MRLFLIITIIAFVLQLFLPWWILAVVAFGLTFWLARRAGQAFLAGFLGIGLSWLVMSLFFHMRNQGLLTAKVAALFTLPNSLLLILLTIFIGALVGGVFALAGYYCRKLFIKNSAPLF